MKELSIEEKAARYDDAIKRIEDIETGKCETTFMFTEGLFEHIFPELAESEDEKIKDLIYLSIEKGMGIPSAEDRKKALAWLEKKGGQDERIRRELIQGTKVPGVEFFRAVTKANEEFIARLTYKPITEANDEFIARLEKKGEQKPTDKCDGCNNAKGCVACVDGSEWAHIEEQNPAWSERDDSNLERGSQYDLAKHFFELGLKAQHDNWKVVDNTNPPQADRNKIYCVFTKGRYILAKVICDPQDDDLLQWKCTEFPFHCYDMCEGDKYMQIV